MTRRKTHEQFLSEMAERRLGVEVLGQYDNDKTPVAVRCRVCGHEWSATPNSLLRGTGCPECARAKRRKTHERFVEELAEKSPQIEVLSPYEGTDASVAIRCRACGFEWSAWPKHLLSGRGCPVCARAKRSKTHEEFVEELAEKSPQIEVLRPYENRETPVAVRCRVCGNEWSARPDMFLRGHGCPKCARAKARKTHEQFAREMAEVNEGIEIVGAYENTDTKIAVRCRSCGHEWSATPYSLLRGCGCPECAKARRRRTHEEFVEELAEKSPQIEVLRPYENRKTPIVVRCRTCGYEWSTRPNGLLSGYGCPECARARKRERGMEARIRRMAAGGLLSEDDVALLRGWGFPFSDGDREKELG